MLRKIELTVKFKKSFRKLPMSVRLQFAKKRLIFYQDPFSATLRTHKLKGNLKDYWSFSISYLYRVVFKFVKKDAALFYDIGDHRIYQ